ncbi:recombinase family protein [Nocardia sp. NBC_01388]|uniref:recombinase family protein n=1 Tax=Nocardia sp. NBC_01388 TaxID=2903596 RepID=UPI00324A5307
MRDIPTAIGYLRRDVSGFRQDWDETRIRSRAKRLGYDLAKIVVFGPNTDAPLERLINVVRNVDADAVIVPTATHFDGAEIPAPLVNVAEVITVDPEQTYARWLLPPWPTTGQPHM